MRRYLGLFFEYLTQYAKVRVSYRGDFFISVATSFAATVSAFGFVYVLFINIPRLSGWRFEEVTFLYGFSLIPFGLFNVVSMNIYEFGNSYIIEGKFDRVLLRPISSLFQVIFETFRLESFQEVATGLFAVWVASRWLHHSWDLVDVLLLVFWAFCGGVIYISIFLLISTASFHFEDRIGMHPPVWNLIAFGRYPLSIYSSFIQFFLSWIIPFGFASFYPSVRLLHRAQFYRYAPLAPVIAAACLSVTLLAWRNGVRHYSSTGS